MTLRFLDLESGENLAFFGSNDDREWVRLGRALKKDANWFECENPDAMRGYRFVKMESEDRGPDRIPVTLRT